MNNQIILNGVELSDLLSQFKDIVKQEVQILANNQKPIEQLTTLIKVVLKLELFYNNTIVNLLECFHIDPNILVLLIEVYLVWRAFVMQNNSNNKQLETQKQIVHTVFKERPKTMLMMEKETGISRANICRYVNEWRKQSKVYLVKKSFCEISKHRAGYYSTDERYNLASNQTSLF